LDCLACPVVAGVNGIEDMIFFYMIGILSGARNMKTIEEMAGDLLVLLLKAIIRKIAIV